MITLLWPNIESILYGIKNNKLTLKEIVLFTKDYLKNIAF